MLTQIYEVSSPAEAASVAAMGVDHVGVLVGDGTFPREHTIAAAQAIAAAIDAKAVFSALFLSADPALIAAWARELAPGILHLGAAPELLSPADVAGLGACVPGCLIMRSIPVTGEESLALAQSYQGIADYLLLDSHRPADRQIGALGVTHDWGISRRIVDLVRVPVVLAGGLGPDNVAEAIRAVRPAGVDSKTRTDLGGTHRKDLGLVRRFLTAATSRDVPGNGQHHNP